MITNSNTGKPDQVVGQGTNPKPPSPKPDATANVAATKSAEDQDFDPDTFNAAAATKITVAALEERTRIATDFARLVWSHAAKEAANNAALGYNKVNFSFGYSSEVSTIVAAETCAILAEDLRQKDYFNIRVEHERMQIVISFSWSDGKPNQKTFVKVRMGKD